jgi:1-acyl-sn-glycerol-3-phosphate acyltransferase
VTKVRAKMAGDTRPALVLYAIARALVVGFGRVWNRMSAEGRERVPEAGAFVLAPVHRSNMDTIYAAVSTHRRIRYMGKDSLWKHGWSAWLLSALGGFPVSRGSLDREALQRAIAVLEAGEPVVVFPEGERKSGPLVQPLFEGAAYLAAKTQVPIVPMGIGGSEDAMPKGSKMIRPSKVHVIIGEPMPPPALRNGRIDREANRAVSEQLHLKLQELFDAAQIRAGAS